MTPPSPNPPLPLGARIGRWARSLPVLVVAFTLSTGIWAVWSVSSNPYALSVAIAVPEGYKGERRIETYGRNPHFHVLVTNTSHFRVNLWKEWCSWGAYNLSFDATDEHGKKFHLKKGDMFFSVNYPDWWTLPPGESLVIDVNFSELAGTSRQKFWEGFPWDRSEAHHITLQAVYEVPTSMDTISRQVWSGKVLSAPLPCTLFREE